MLTAFRLVLGHPLVAPMLGRPRCGKLLQGSCPSSRYQVHCSTNIISNMIKTYNEHVFHCFPLIAANHSYHAYVMSWFGLVFLGSRELRWFDVSWYKLHQQDQAVLRLHVAPKVSLHGRYFPQARLGGLLCRFGQKLNICYWLLVILC